MNEQKNRINALENVAEEVKPKSDDADLKIRNAPGKLVLIKQELGDTIIFLQPQLGNDGIKFINSWMLIKERGGKKWFI